MTEWTEDDVRRLAMNPFYAITIEPELCEPHEPMVTEDQWVAANVRMIGDLGAEGYLRTLLDVLKGNYPVADPEEAER
jgi:hypothetical protein